METILDILHELHDDVDFSTESGLVGQGILNAPGRWCLSHSRWVASGGAFPLGLMHG